MGGDVYIRAADIFVERAVPHVCWAVGIADGYQSREFESSAAVQAFAWWFADIENGDDKLQAGAILAAVDGDEQGVREFSLLLLAMMAAIAEAGELR